MKIRLFGRIIIIPNWLKYLCIFVLLAILAILGYFIQKSREENKITLNTTEIPSATAKNQGIGSTEEPKETEKPNTIFVYIVGEVTNSDVFELPSGSILKDLIMVAGGFTSLADKEAVNLAFSLKNGMMIKIPGLYDTDKTWLLDNGSSGSSESATKSGIVNINTATVDELCTLPGIGESTALKIISYRTENGPFNSIADIMSVSGIKEARFNEIKKYITVG